MSSLVLVTAAVVVVVATDAVVHYYTLATSDGQAMEPKKATEGDVRGDRPRHAKLYFPDDGLPTHSST